MNGRGSSFLSFPDDHPGSSSGDGGGLGLAGRSIGELPFGAPSGAGVLLQSSSSPSFFGMGSPSVVQKWAPDSPSRTKLRSEYQLRLRSSPGKRRMSTDSTGSSSSLESSYKRSNSPVSTPLRRSASDEVYSDRFIPSRSGSQMEIAYSLMESSHALTCRGCAGGAGGGGGSAAAPTNGHSNTQASSSLGNSGSSGSSVPGGGGGGGDGMREGQSILNMLLRTELLGLDYGPSTTPPRHHSSHHHSHQQQQQPQQQQAGAESRGDGESRPLGCSGTGSGSNLFKFKSPRMQYMQDLGSRSYSLSPVGSSSRRLLATPRKAKRKIPKVPFKVLDAPALQDDFYLNLVDWSSLNVLAVGLGSCVYLWSACTSKVTKLCDLGPEDCVTSVSWTQRGTHLAVGTNLGEVQIWETSRCRKIRTMPGHSARIGTMSWNAQVLASGSRDRLILLRDVRVREPYVSKLQGHKQEVCGLRWSFDDNQLASGGNDNKLFIWNLHSSSPVQRFNEHTAAVKAIAWSPHQHGLLASGGGTADRCIRFWNTLTGAALHCVDTGSQVCNLMWSKNINELVSTHGYSLNQIIVWRYPSMTKVATLTGHTYRVLYLAMSPDGQTIVTGAGDETLRFWNAFPGPKSNDGSRLGTSLLFPAGADIR